MLRLFNIAVVLGIIGAAFVVYSLEFTTRDAERRIASLERNLASKEEEIKLLQAEWSSLTRPERLQQLAEQHLELRRVSASQLVSAADLAARVPDEPVAKLEADGKDPIGDILKAME